MTPPQRTGSHPGTLLFLGLTASLWAVADGRGTMSLVWLGLLCAMVYRERPAEFRQFFRRLSKLGISLVVISLLQIVFRRTGASVLVFKGVTLATHDGVLEAALLWIRFMILFALAALLARIRLFDFLALLGKLRVPLSLSLMLSMTLRLIPSIFHEARRVLFFFRFSGLRFGDLGVRARFQAAREMISALLMRSMTYLFDTAMAMELRGWAQPQARRLEAPLPFSRADAFLLALAVGVNGAGIWWYLK